MGAKIQLTLGSLGYVDSGSIQKHFADKLQRCVKDCFLRPGIEKARKVTLTLDVVPVASVDGACDKVMIGAEIRSKIPPIESTAITLNANKMGHAWFIEEDGPESEREPK